MNIYALDGSIGLTTLPPYRVTVTLFESFVANVEHVCYILHDGSMRGILKRVYLGLNQGKGKSIATSHAALTLSMLSLAAFFYQPYDVSEIATTGSECLQLTAFWGRCALRAMSHSQQTSAGTLEDVQAHILMTYVAFHVEGFSTLRHHHMGMSVSLATSLRLHRIDLGTDPSKLITYSLSAMIDREVKRRVFWHVASTDW